MGRAVPLVVVLAAAAVAEAGKPAPLRAQPRTMFLTEATGTAKLSTWALADGLTGLAAANRICQNSAEAEGLDDPESYRAWLSVGATDAWCNVAGFTGTKAGKCGQATLPEAGPWVRTDGRPFARSLGELTALREVLYPPRFDEAGVEVPVGSGQVWTGTDANGVEVVGKTCSAWTSEGFGVEDFAISGNMDFGSVEWTSWTNSGCNGLLRLYCLQSGTAPALPAFGEPGMWAFVTSTTGSGDLGSWPDAGDETGLEAGAEICRAAARRAHLPEPESYRSWASQDIGGTGPWRRLDGVAIAADFADLLDDRIEAPVEVDEAGTHQTGRAWTGITGVHCGEWVGTGTGIVGSVASAHGHWIQSDEIACTEAARLYCFSSVPVLFADGFERGGTREWRAVVP